MAGGTQRHPAGEGRLTRAAFRPRGAARARRWAPPPLSGRPGQGEEDRPPLLRRCLSARRHDAAQCSRCPAGRPRWPADTRCALRSAGFSPRGAGGRPAPRSSHEREDRPRRCREAGMVSFPKMCLRKFLFSGAADYRFRASMLWPLTRNGSAVVWRTPPNQKVTSS